ncbi:MAG: hypothetical protein ACUZ8H_10370 [Candidatus Anammoxibacter sp.]
MTPNQIDIRKRLVLEGIHSAYATFGGGYDMTLKVNDGVIDVKITDFQQGRVLDKESDYISFHSMPMDGEGIKAGFAAVQRCILKIQHRKMGNTNNRA